MQIDRAVILAVPGDADRPWSNSGSTPKPLLPVATRPILFHTLDTLRAAGVAEAVLLAEEEAVPAFRDAVGDGTRWDMQIACRGGARPLGVSGALAATADFVADRPVIVQHADAMLRTNLRDHARGFAADELDALALMLASEGAPRSSPAVAGSYMLNASAVGIMRDGPISSDPLTRLRREGGHVRMLDVEGCLACHSDELRLLEANRQALTALRTEVTDAMLEDCEVQGNVVIHPTASLRNTLVRGPAIIGADTEIIDSYVGPYTSIGADTCIQGTEIEHSIVMDGARLMFVGSRLETSIIGRGASIVRRFDMPRAVRMSIGDGAEVALS